MFGVLDWINLAAGALVGAVLGYYIGEYQGEAAGRAQVEAQNRQADFDQLKERMETDAEIRAMDDAGLCRLLGGVFADGACR